MFGDPLKLIPLVVYLGGFAALFLKAVTFDQFVVIMGLAAAGHAGISALNNTNPKAKSGRRK